MSQMSLIPYLFFGGRCEEAIAFYKQAIRAEVQFLMYHKDSPEPPPPGMLQKGFENKVMHSTLKIGAATLYVSDGCDDKSQFSGFNVSLGCETEQDVQRCYHALAEGGQAQMPPVKTFWSPSFGMLKDKFGVSWMVMVQEPAT